MRAVVVGAGIMGASVAYHLAMAGARVWLVERAALPSGTTARSFAWVNANQKTPRDYFDLNLAGLREHIRLASEIGPKPWFHPTGNLVWAGDQAELDARVARLRAWGYQAEWLTAAQVMHELEPNLRFPDPALPVAFFPEEAWVDAPRLAGRLIRLAVEREAETRFGAEVTAITFDGAQAAAVLLATGERLAADAVVNAAGPDADQVARLAGMPLPLAPTRGLLIRLATPTADPPVRSIIHTPLVNIRPDSGQRVVIHHDSIDRRLGARLTVERHDPLARDLIERACVVVNGLDTAVFSESRIGTRAIPADGRSCVGGVAGRPGYYEAVTHSGVTLGPLLGRLLTREILEGMIDPLLRPFRPDRFPRTGHEPEQPDAQR